MKEVMDAPVCEVCGESEASCRTEMVGMCDECFEAHAREALAELTGPVCASVSRGKNGFLRVCLAPYGVEHLHHG
jgi:hypothetical protein